MAVVLQQSGLTLTTSKSCLHPVACHTKQGITSHQHNYLGDTACMHRPTAPLASLYPLKSKHIVHSEPNTSVPAPPDSRLFPWHGISCDGDARHKIIGHQVAAVHVQLLMTQTLHNQFWPTNDFGS